MQMLHPPAVAIFRIHLDVHDEAEVVEIEQAA
jgi:hypothetical protein